jgi:hypothetical protein
MRTGCPALGSRHGEHGASRRAWVRRRAPPGPRAVPDPGGASLLGTGLFQFFSIFVLDDGDGERWRQYLTYAGPSGVLAAAGATLGWPVHRAATSPVVRGLAAAAVIVGTVIVVAVIAGLITVTTLDSGPTF